MTLFSPSSLYFKFTLIAIEKISSLLPVYLHHPTSSLSFSLCRASTLAHSLSFCLSMSLSSSLSTIFLLFQSLSSNSLNRILTEIISKESSLKLPYFSYVDLLSPFSWAFRLLLPIFDTLFFNLPFFSLLCVSIFLNLNHLQRSTNVCPVSLQILNRQSICKQNNVTDDCQLDNQVSNSC